MQTQYQLNDGGLDICFRLEGPVDINMKWVRSRSLYGSASLEGINSPMLVDKARNRR